MKIGIPADKSAPAPAATPSAGAVGHRATAAPDISTPGGSQPVAHGPKHGVAHATGAGAAGAAVPTSTATTTAIPATADPSARIALSSTASTLLTGGSTPEFDAAKVARLSQAIESGTFKVDPHAIADKLISNAKEVLGKVQG